MKAFAYKVLLFVKNDDYCSKQQFYTKSLVDILVQPAYVFTYVGIKCQFCVNFELILS